MTYSGSQASSLVFCSVFAFAEALQREFCPRIRLERVQELLEKQKSLQQVLSLRLKELRRVCLQEAVPKHDRRRIRSQWEGLRQWICCFEKLDVPNWGTKMFVRPSFPSLSLSTGQTGFVVQDIWKALGGVRYAANLEFKSFLLCVRVQTLRIFSFKQVDCKQMLPRRNKEWAAESLSYLGLGSQPSAEI